MDPMLAIKNTNLFADTGPDINYDGPIATAYLNLGPYNRQARAGQGSRYQGRYP